MPKHEIGGSRPTARERLLDVIVAAGTGEEGGGRTLIRNGALLALEAAAAVADQIGSNWYPPEDGKAADAAGDAIRSLLEEVRNA